MSAMIRDRIFPFDGDDVDYIAWLESKLVARQSHSYPRGSSPSTPPRTPEPLSSDVRDKWTFLYCSPARNLSRSPIVSRYSQHRRFSLLNKVGHDRIRLPQWQRELDRFTKSIPAVDEWIAKRAACGFTTAKSNHLAIQLMLGRAVLSDLYPDEKNVQAPDLQPLDNTEMILRGCKYGLITNQYADNGRLTILVGKYQKLIFISYCTVLLSLGNSKETINWMMRRYISDSDDKNLERYRSGCLWMNRCVSSLLRLGWGYKSWEIFVLCARSPHQYGRFSDASESLAKFTDALGVSETPIYEDGWIPYCIPCIVKCLAGETIGLSQICLCLGYDFGLISQIFLTLFRPSTVETLFVESA